MSKRNAGIPELPPFEKPTSTPDAIRRRLYEISIEMKELTASKKAGGLSPEEYARAVILTKELSHLVNHPANVIPDLDGGKRHRKTRKARKTRRRY